MGRRARGPGYLFHGSRYHTGSAGVEDGELLERAWPEVAHVVDFVALEQRHDPAAVLRTRGDLQDQVTVAERLVVDLQGSWS